MYGSRSLALLLGAVISTLLLTACGGGGSDSNRPSNNANLTSLLVADAVLDPAFASGTTSYAASVTGGTTETRVTAITTDRRARLTINGDAATSGSASDPISLVIGETLIEVVVTAENGSQRTYSVRVTRPAPGTDARLDALTLSAGPLLQPFDPDQFDYDATFGYLATTTRATGTPSDPLAESLSINDKLTPFDAPSEPLPLEVGTATSTISLEVTAEDGTTTRTYEVDVSREAFATVAQAGYLKAGNTDPGDRFGSSAALTRDLLVVGAPEEQSLANSVDGNQADNSGNAVGAAYLFERTGDVWDLGHYLKAENADNGDRFGAASASGQLLAIGAPEEQSRNGSPGDNSGNAVGAVYLFDPDGAGLPEQTGYLKADNADDLDRFGSALAMNGQRLLVGAPFEASNAAGVNGDGSDNSLNNAGAAYLFEADADGNYQQRAYLKASNPTSGTDNQFGNALAVSGDLLAVAAWQESGGSAGIDGDQTDTSAPRAGAVYLFETTDGQDWQQVAYVKASNPGLDHSFGAAVAIDEATLAVGAPGENSGAQGSGAVYVFSRDAAGIWTQEAFLKADTVGLNDGFGADVRLVGDLLAIGAPGERSDATGINGGDNNENAVSSGAVYLFERSAPGTWAQIAFVKASNTDPGDRFGSALALDGDTLIITAPSEQSAATGVDGDESNNTLNDAGAAYVID